MRKDIFFDNYETPKTYNMLTIYLKASQEFYFADLTCWCWGIA